MADPQVHTSIGSREAAITTNTGAVLTQATLDELRGNLRGEIVRPGDESYEEARKVWNGMIDRRPALIVRCSGAADVVAAVRFAREHSLPVAVRGGGHNVSGSAVCDGGMVIDLSRMNGVRADPVRRVARVAAGARLGDIDHETQVSGLAMPVGVVSATGIAGLALHGGMGFLTRKYGLTSDNLVAADLVTPDGRLLVVDEHQHPDLFWALRGGGGNFGVVTSFEFRLHPVGPDVAFGMVFYPADKAPLVLRFFREYMAQAPDELMAIAIFWNAPADESMPEAYRAAPVIVIAACYAGPVQEGERAIQPLREIDAPVADLSGPMPYLAAQKLFDPDYPNGRRYYWKSLYLSNLGDEAIRALAEHAARRPSPISSLDVWALGGAFGRVSPEATAFGRRDAAYLLGIEANWDDPAGDQANVAWAREVFRDMQRFSSGGSYLNFPGFAEEGEDLLKKAYGANYARLQSVKAQYDPENVLRHNLNIQALA
jgi:FAD/FMN-containing dehydrogenase